MLHVLRTVGATGWLVSEKVVSLLWLAILAPGYYPHHVCALPVPFEKLGTCSASLVLIQLCSCCAFSILKCMCYFTLLTK